MASLALSAKEARARASKYNHGLFQHQSCQRLLRRWAKRYRDWASLKEKYAGLERFQLARLADRYSNRRLADHQGDELRKVDTLIEKLRREYGARYHDGLTSQPLLDPNTRSEIATATAQDFLDERLAFERGRYSRGKKNILVDYFPTAAHVTESNLEDLLAILMVEQFLYEYMYEFYHSLIKLGPPSKRSEMHAVEILQARIAEREAKEETRWLWDEGQEGVGGILAESLAPEAVTAMTSDDAQAPVTSLRFFLPATLETTSVKSRIEALRGKDLPPPVFFFIESFGGFLSRYELTNLVAFDNLLHMAERWTSPGGLPE